MRKSVKQRPVDLGNCPKKVEEQTHLITLYGPLLLLPFFFFQIVPKLFQGFLPCFFLFYLLICCLFRNIYLYIFASLFIISFRNWLPFPRSQMRIAIKNMDKLTHALSSLNPWKAPSGSFWLTSFWWIFGRACTPSLSIFA